MRLEGIHHVSALTADPLDCIEFYAGVLGLAAAARPTDRERPTRRGSTSRPRSARPGACSPSPRCPGSAADAPAPGWSTASNGGSPRPSARLLVRALGRGRRVEAERTGARAPRASLRGPRGPRARARRRTSRRGVAPIGPDPDGLGSAGSRESAPTPLPRRAPTFSPAGSSSSSRGDRLHGSEDGSGGDYAYDDPPAERGVQGAGTVHHVAWACDPGSSPRGASG